jgi:hypothetical protein
VTPAVHVLVFDGFADWEPAFALAELRRTGGLDVVTVGFTEAEVRSMGGLRVMPDRSLAGLSPSAVRLLLLPVAIGGAPTPEPSSIASSRT